MAFRGPFTDRSGSIAVGGTAQWVTPDLGAGVNAETRSYLLFQNVSDTNMWINFGIPAVADQPSILIEPGKALIFGGAFVPHGRLSVICATIAKKFTCKEG